MRKSSEFKSSFESMTKVQRGILLLLSLLFIIIQLVFTIILSGGSFATIKTSRQYRAGELSDENIYAPYDYSYIDEVETAIKLNSASDAVYPQFSYSLTDTVYMRSLASDFYKEAIAGNSIEAFFSRKGLPDPSGIGKRLDSLSEKNRILAARLSEEGIIQLILNGIISDVELIPLVQDNRFYVEVEKAKDFNFNTEIEKVAISDLFLKSDIPAYVISWLGNTYSVLDVSLVSLISDAVSLLAIPNVHYDKALTDVLIDKAESQVEPVVVEIRKGDQILKVDTIVTDSQLRTIERYQTFESYKISPAKAFASILFLGLALFCFYYFFFSSIQYKYRLWLYSMIVMILVLLSITGGFFISYYLLSHDISYVDPYLPYFIAILLASYITNKKKIGFGVAALFACSQLLWPTSKSFTIVYFLLVALVSVSLTNYGKNRIDIIFQALIASGLAGLISIAVSLLYSLSIMEIVYNMIASMANIIFSYILMSIILPVLEVMFNIPTSYRLHELSFTDTPSLNRLNQVAQGTYNHVKNVSDLAYAAAKSIGANADLAKVGALYHDIGKAEHPEYFIENQNGKNAHDEISFTLSAAIIKSHVKIGVEKAKEIGLPQEVIDIIGEHHGNDLIKYFYNEAVKDSKQRASLVSEEDFRYNGKIPSTKESAIVMLADCCEAATRTIKNPTHQKYDKFIQSIILDKINYKQLDNSQLTITDLQLIKESFIQLLVGRDHQRIEYNKD